MLKNVGGQSLSFSLVNVATGAAITSGTTTVYFSGDGGSQVASPQTPTHLGNGQWRWAPNQAETNYAHIALAPVSSVGAVPQTINVYPRELVVDANVVTILGDASAADVATLGALSSLETYIGNRTLPNGNYATASAVVTAQSSLTTIADLIEADKFVDTETTPWSVVFKRKGTETILLRQNIYDTAGVGVTSINTVIGRLVEET